MLLSFGPTADCCARYLYCSLAHQIVAGGAVRTKPAARKQDVESWASVSLTSMHGNTLRNPCKQPYSRLTESLHTRIYAKLALYLTDGRGYDGASK